MITKNVDRQQWLRRISLDSKKSLELVFTTTELRTRLKLHCMLVQI